LPFAGAAVATHHYHHVWKPLQRLFLSPHLRNQLARDLALTGGRCRLPHVVDRHGHRSRSTKKSSPSMMRPSSRSP
jgi:hypothetical protein